VTRELINGFDVRPKFTPTLRQAIAARFRPLPAAAGVRNCARVSSPRRGTMAA
jgi:hypothetical protein